MKITSVDIALSSYEIIRISFGATSDLAHFTATWRHYKLNAWIVIIIVQKNNLLKIESLMFLAAREWFMFSWHCFWSLLPAILYFIGLINIANTGWAAVTKIMFVKTVQKKGACMCP